MVFLQGVGVSTSLAVRIYKKYGDGSISVVRNEPYRLAAEVWGIGFKTADTIAQAVGIPHDSPQRVQAGIQYTLSEAADNGHCYLPEPNLLTDAAQILGVPADLVRACLAELAAAEGVIREPVQPGIGRRDHPGGVPGAVPPRRDRAGRRPAAALDRAGRSDARLRHRRLGQGAGLAAGPHRGGAGRRAGAGGAAGVDAAGGGADRRAGLRQVVHRQIGDHAGGGEAGEDRAGGAHRAGGETVDRAVRAPGHHRAPAAAAAPGRGPQLRPGPSARRRPDRGRRGQHARPDPGQQTDQGGPAGGAPAAGRRRGPAALGRRRGGAARRAGRRHHPPGPADHRSSGRPSSPGWWSTRTGSTPASPRCSASTPTSSCSPPTSPRPPPSGWSTSSPGGSPASSASPRGTSRC